MRLVCMPKDNKTKENIITDKVVVQLLLPLLFGVLLT